MRGAVRRRGHGPAASAGMISLLAGLPPPRDSPERVGEITEKVLSRPEFQARGQSLIERGYAWVIDRINDTIEALISAAASGGAASILITVVFLAVVAGVGIVVWRVLRNVTSEAARPAGEDAPLRPATDWRAEADAHERAGAWRQALRCRYRALVADLSARGLLDEVPGTTAGEYRGQLGRNAPAAAGDFGGATELFELAWYGDAPTGEAESSRFRDLAGRVLQEARR